jgi:FhuF 2Fe-2S C-terminal domain
VSRLVAQLGERLRALTPDDPDRYAVSELSSAIPAQSASAAGWLPVGDVIPAMMAGSGEHLTISPAVAGARIAGSLGYAVAGRLAVAIALAGQAYDPGPGSLVLGLDDEGLVERVGIRRPTLAVLPTDPLAGSPGVSVSAELTALIGWAADRAWATLDPLIDELHRATRYGVVPIWNLVADAILSPATAAPLLAGLDQRAGHAVGAGLIDRLIGCGAPIRRRGTVREQRVDGRLLLASVRGSCCLYFRQDQELCESCPLGKAAQARIGISPIAKTR